MTRRKLPTLSPTFADTPTSQLINDLEQCCIFASHELEQELDARLAISGRSWRFTAPGRIEIYYQEKSRRDQQPCNIGLFDQDATSQGDLADVI